MRILISIWLCFFWAISASANNLNYEFKRGIAAYKSGEYVIAGQKLKIVLHEHPKNLTALYFYGMSKHRLGTYRTAEKTLKYAHKLAPDVPEIRVALVDLFSDMGRMDEAQTHLDSLKSQLAACENPCEIEAPLEKAIETASKAIAAKHLP